MNLLEKGSDIKALDAKLKLDEQKFRESKKVPVTECMRCGLKIMEEEFYYDFHDNGHICEGCIDYYKRFAEHD